MKNGSRTHASPRTPPRPDRDAADGPAYDTEPAADHATAIRTHLEAQAEEIVEFTSELVLAESPSTEPSSVQPVLELLAGAFADTGARVHRIDGRRTGGHLLIRPGGGAAGRPLQLVLGHADTVWPLGTLETMPLRVDGEAVRGPGVFDMKAGLAIGVYAFRALYELGLEPSVAPVLFFTSDEEIGSIESGRHTRRLARRACRALVLEPALGREGRLKTARKGVGRFEIRVVGKSAHGGLEPELGASAIVELSHVIQKLHALGDPERGTTVNVGTIEGGVRPNVVADSSRAVVDVRVKTMEDARFMERAIREIDATTPGTRIEVDGRIGRAPMERTRRNSRLFEAARRLGAALGLELEEGLSGGASDGNVTSLHTATLDGLGAVGDGAHARHEYVFVESLSERAALLALLMLLPPDPAEADRSSEESDEAEPDAERTT